MPHSPTGTPSTPSPIRRPVGHAELTALSVLTLLGPVGFTAVYLVAGATRPGYDAGQQSISALALGPGAVVQQANFVVLGAVVLVTAATWRRVLHPGPADTWYPIMRGIEGAALIGIGFFTTDPTPAYPPGSPAVPAFSTAHGVAHFGFLFAIIFAQMGGLLVFTARFRGDPRWRGWTIGSIAAAVLINVLIALFGVANAHQFAYAGVIERLATNIETLWTIILLARLWLGTPLVHPACERADHSSPDSAAARIHNDQAGPGTGRDAGP